MNILFFNFKMCVYGDPKILIVKNVFFIEGTGGWGGGEGTVKFKTRLP